jgi:hypothetical protein
MCALHCLELLLSLEVEILACKLIGYRGAECRALRSHQDAQDARLQFIAEADLPG